jgi:hypothetical protein
VGIGVGSLGSSAKPFVDDLELTSELEKAHLCPYT